MPRVLSPEGERLMGMLPPYYAEDEPTLAVQGALGQELERLEGFVDTVLDEAFPQNAGDDYRLLGIWEAQLGLPVEPSGVTVAQRRANVLANLKKGRVATGLGWEAALTEALGTTQWTYTEGPTDYTITIHMPFAASSFTGSQVQGIARDITPANLVIAFGFSEGFILGASRLGDVL